MRIMKIICTTATQKYSKKTVKQNKTIFLQKMKIYWEIVTVKQMKFITQHEFEKLNATILAMK